MKECIPFSHILSQIWPLCHKRYILANTSYINATWGGGTVVITQIYVKASCNSFFNVFYTSKYIYILMAFATSRHSILDQNALHLSLFLFYINEKSIQSRTLIRHLAQLSTWYPLRSVRYPVQLPADLLRIRLTYH